MPPAPGKAMSKKVKNKKTGRTRTVSYGQSGKASDGSRRVQPNNKKKADSYCARSYGIKVRLSKKKQNDPNTANNLSRTRWKCRGKKSSA